MTPTNRRRVKPTGTEELARVLTITKMLDEEIRKLFPPPPPNIIGPDTEIITPQWDLLTIADRIAARTEGL